MLKRQGRVAAAVLALVCIVGFGTAQAANITASETVGEVATLVGTQFDITAFTSVSNGESADGSGQFQANSTANGQALVVLLEGVGGPFSDWLHLVYTGSNPGGPGTETITVHWRSDSDPGGVPALPTGVVPMFLVETGGSQEVTALLAASAAASGFAFPSNITIQAQSDAPEPVPEPASLVLLGSGLVTAGIWRRRRARA
jgi:hypothetical protein